MEPKDVALYLRQCGVTVHSAAEDTNRPGGVIVWFPGAACNPEVAREIAASMPGVRRATLDPVHPGGQQRCVLRLS